jgi:glyceraldehyde 3-phosphate dehydrogenase
MTRVAINGFGRIGRATFRILRNTPGLDTVAINDLAPATTLAYLLKYDTVYGRYPGRVDADRDALIVDGTRYRVFDEKDPGRLPWRELDIDVVFECTGVFNRREDLARHVQAGARVVILSAPTANDDVPTVVHGVNTPDRSATIISCASCTTNCITPVVEVLDRRIGVRKATVTTIHAYTATQSLIDRSNKNARRGRAAAANLVPAATGAARATTKALPSLRGRFDGVAVRAPVPVGSLADIVVLSARATTVEEVNAIFKAEAETDRYRGILGVSSDPIVSSDVIQESYASILDLGLTQVVDGDLVKVMSWYDNEWGYASQLVREAQAVTGSESAVPARR